MQIGKPTIRKIEKLKEKRILKKDKTCKHMQQLTRVNILDQNVKKVKKTIIKTMQQSMSNVHVQC